jgi:hypothetical protein
MSVVPRERWLIPIDVLVAPLTALTGAARPVVVGRPLAVVLIARLVEVLVKGHDSIRPDRWRRVKVKIVAFLLRTSASLAKVSGFRA